MKLPNIEFELTHIEYKWFVKYTEMFLIVPINIFYHINIFVLSVTLFEQEIFHKTIYVFSPRFVFYFNPFHSRSWFRIYILSKVRSYVTVDRAGQTNQSLDYL